MWDEIVEIMNPYDAICGSDSTESQKETPCLLIRVEDRDINTQQFKSFELAQSQMMEELKVKAHVSQEKFDNWNGMLMVESGDGKWAFWSDGGYLNSPINPIDWQIVELEV